MRPSLLHFSNPCQLGFNPQPPQPIFGTVVLKQPHRRSQHPQSHRHHPHQSLKNPTLGQQSNPKRPKKQPQPFGNRQLCRNPWPQLSGKARPKFENLHQAPSTPAPHPQSGGLRPPFQTSDLSIQPQKATLVQNQMMFLGSKPSTSAFTASIKNISQGSTRRTQWNLGSTLGCFMLWMSCLMWR